MRQDLAEARWRSGALAFVLIALSGSLAFMLFGVWGVALSAVLLLLLSGLGRGAEWLLRLQRAVPIAPHQAPGLFHLLRNLAARASVAVPRLYVIPSSAPNAMAAETSDGRGLIALSRGLMDLLSPAELQAVLAHELSHLSHKDTRLLHITSAGHRATLTLLRGAFWLSLLVAVATGQGYLDWLVIAVLSFTAPVVLQWVVSALSRTREFAADASAALLTGAPSALASALFKLEHHSETQAARLLRGARPPDWLASHPVTSERIRRLGELDQMGSSYRRLEFPALRT